MPRRDNQPPRALAFNRKHDTLKHIAARFFSSRSPLLLIQIVALQHDTHNALFKHFELAMTPSASEKIGARHAAAAAEAYYHIGAIDQKIDQKTACIWWSNARWIFGGSAIDRFIEDIDRANVGLAARVYGEASREHAERVFELGINLDAQRRFDEAEELYRQALRRLEDVGAGTTLLAANAFNRLGVVLDYQKKHSEAAEFLEKSLDIRQSILEQGDREIALILAALGMNLSHRGLYATAEMLIRQALDIIGDNDPSAATIFHNLGLCLGNQEHLLEAEEMHRRGLALREQIDPDHYETGDSLAYLSHNLYLQKQYVEAEALIRRALVITAASWGQDHRETADNFYTLGRTLHYQARFEDAEQAHRQALEIRERVLGPAHPDTAASLAHLGWTLYRAGRAKDAIFYLRRAFEIRESVLGRDHPDTRISAQKLLEAEGGSQLGKAKITACNLDELRLYTPDAFSHVLSILDPGTADPVWPEGWDNLCKLTFRFHDATVTAPQAKMFSIEHLDALLGFANQAAATNSSAILVISDFGISRSTACAGVIQAHLTPNYSGVDLFREILKTRDIAWPNLHIVELGDARLGRHGDLINGAKAIYRYQLEKHPDWAERLAGAGRGREVDAADEGPEISL